MKYELVKNKLDDYTLKYKDKEFNFKTDIKLISEVQSINKNARLKMLQDLTEKGLSIKQLSVEEKKDGKTYIDNSNKVEMENIYIEEEMTNFFNDICKRYFKMDYLELILDIGLDESEVEKFSTELIGAMTGTTPSQ